MIEINENCQVSPIKQEEIPCVIQYFLGSKKAYLEQLGTDSNKLPDFDEWYSYMLSEYKKPLNEKQYFCLGWYYNGQLIGHSCIDQINFKKQAYMHLHIWQPEFRYQQLGNTFLWLSLKYYFEHFLLQRIYCQPKASNTAPNQLLVRLGFNLVKTYETVPHRICFKQQVNLYLLDKMTFQQSDKQEEEL